MNDDFGTRLGATLREQAPEQHPHLTLDDVLPTARRIRRRRAGAAMGGVAAALTAVAAIGTPVAITALSGDDPGPAPAPVSPGLAEEWAAPREVTLDVGAPVEQGGLDAGWFDAELAGVGLPIPERAHDAAAPLGGSRWVYAYRTDGGDRKLFSVDFSGVTGNDPDQPVVRQAIEDAYTADLLDGFAVSDAGDLAAFSTPDGDLTLLSADGRDRVVTRLPSPATVVDLVGDAGCVDGTGCEVVVSYVDGRAPELVSGDGTRTVVADDAAGVDAATDELVATRGPARDDLTACATVASRGEGTVLWESCDVLVDSFSPDGRYAVVTDSYQSGTGPTRLGVAEARTGKVLTWISPGAEEGFVDEDVVWTDAGALQITSHTAADQTWRLHEVGADGTVVQRIRPSGGDEFQPPFFAVTRP